MIIVKDLESEKSANIVMTQKFKNNITRLTGEIALLESDKALINLYLINVYDIELKKVKKSLVKSFVKSLVSKN